MMIITMNLRGHFPTVIVILGIMLAVPYMVIKQCNVFHGNIFQNFRPIVKFMEIIECEQAVLMDVLTWEIFHAQIDQLMWHKNQIPFEEVVVDKYYFI